MKAKNVLAGAALAGAGLLLYGALFETDKLVRERRTLRLPRWPNRLDGYRIGLIADLHIRDRETIDLAKRSIAAILDDGPDMVVLAGDIVAYWKRGMLDMVECALEDLILMKDRVLVVPGNHDYFAGDPDWLIPLFQTLGIQLLRNECRQMDGINWIGVDSAAVGMADPYSTIREANVGDPMVVLWHEPDMVDVLPKGPALMLSGHSHGGQFTTPWGWAPMTTRLGTRYIRGYYPNAPTPLYVSRGLATTGPPARLFCRPEVSILTLRSKG
jgi:uncharacterized protein